MGVDGPDRELPCSSQVTEPTRINPSYFLPGKLSSRPVHFLIDSGCTSNIISQHVFERISKGVRDQLMPYESQGRLADGSQMEISGTIELSGRLRDVAFVSAFLVCPITEDAILGMPFLENNACVMDFRLQSLLMKGRELKCTNRFGDRLQSKVQVVHKVTIPSHSEMIVKGRLCVKTTNKVGVVDRWEENPKVAPGLLLGTCLAEVDGKLQVPIRCINITQTPIVINAGSCVGMFHAVEIPGDGEVDVRRITDVLNKGSSQTEDHLSVDSMPEHVRSVYQEAIKLCTTDRERRSIGQLLVEFQDVFSRSDTDVGRTHLVEHSIPVKPGTRPIKQQPRRLGPEKEAEVGRQVKELSEQGLITPSNSAWSSPVVLVKRKDGNWRFCIDYRQLNSVTEQDCHPLPRIDESLDALAGSKIFSTLDLISGYWQLPLDEDAQDKSSFVTRDGLWKWTVLPFGLTSAPACFSRLMERVMRGLHWKILLLYLDDIIVFSEDLDSHVERLAAVFERLRAAGLKLKPRKCDLFKAEVKYLGHVVSAEGVATNPEKIVDVKEWPVPKCVRELKAFLGTAGYYRQYVPNFSAIASPLHRITSKSASFCWSPECQKSFETLKQCLVTSEVLGYPDPSLSFILDTDASAEGIGGVLSQVQNGKERVISYYSKSFSPPERNYCVTRKELLAVIKCVKHFRPYLYGRQFLVRTDHASLIWLARRKEPSCQVARWLEILGEFQYKIEHRKGVRHGNADGLSRMTCSDCRQCKRIETRDGGPTRNEVVTELLVDPNRSSLFPPDGVEKSTGSSPVLSPCSAEIGWEKTGHIGSKPGDNKTEEPSPDILTLTSPSVDDKVVRLQTQHPSDVADIYKAVEGGQDIPREKLESGSRELRKLHSLLPALKIIKGKLVIQMKTNGRMRNCIICPATARKTVIWETHRLTHSGIMRTARRVRMQWFWPGMMSEIRKLIRTCETCQLAKQSTVPKSGNRQRLYSGRPWQKVAVDLVGPLPQTERGNQWILVLTDHFTRWQDALPLPDATAPVVAGTLDSRIFCYLGLPEQIHSDQGAQFQSSLMLELCRLWKVTKSKTTPYHPQGNSMVERMNRTLGDSLRSLLLGRSQEDWDLLLPQIMRGFRASPQSATGETANYLMLGRETRLPDQIVYGTSDSEPTTTQQYALDLLERLQEAHDKLRQQQLEIRTEDTEEPPLYEVGDLVGLVRKRRRQGQSEKLCPKFVGPYRVIEVRPNHTYKLERNGQESIQNESRLKPFVECPEEVGQAPFIPEPVRQPNMKGARKHREKKAPDPLFSPEDFPPLVPEIEDKLVAGPTPPVEVTVQPDISEERPRRSLKHYMVDYVSK